MLVWCCVLLVVCVVVAPCSCVVACGDCRSVSCYERSRNIYVLPGTYVLISLDIALAEFTPVVTTKIE